MVDPKCSEMRRAGVTTAKTTCGLGAVVSLRYSSALVVTPCAWILSSCSYVVVRGRVQRRIGVLQNAKILPRSSSGIASLTFTSYLYPLYLRTTCLRACSSIFVRRTGVYVRGYQSTSSRSPSTPHPKKDYYATCSNRIPLRDFPRLRG